MAKILVTGGAGFIGSHLVDLLVKKGNEVVILDNLDPQVHPSSKEPVYLNKEAAFIKGDVRTAKDIAKAIDGCEVVFHEAAAVGVGQSMYQINHYTDVSVRGTAMLWDYIVNNDVPIKKFVVAASMSSYGEGLYECPSCGLLEPSLRSEKQMKKGDWEVKCPSCKSIVKKVPTPETKTQHCNSVYALNKKDQEEMSLIIGKTYGIPTVALRYFNVFGTRQSLSNPYTGVAAIFLSRVKNNNNPVVYEDGNQTRDFVSVYDVANANFQVMKSSNADYQVLNVGSGVPISISEVAETIIELHNSDVKVEITNKFRKGDIRHCFADNSKIKSKLKWKPTISFKEGLKEIIEWSASVEATDKFEEATKELRDKGLI